MSRRFRVGASRAILIARCAVLSCGAVLGSGTLPAVAADTRRAGPTSPTLPLPFGAAGASALPDALDFGRAASPGIEPPGEGGFLPSPTSPSAAQAPAKPGLDEADRAFGAFQRGYFATALSEATSRLANVPQDGAAMTLIGESYSEGLAVKEDAAEADRWFKLASQHGNREGSFAYGLALLRGTGLPKDTQAAIPYLEKAAAQGHAGALYNLGVVALETDVKTRDFAKSAGYFRKAADLGDIDAEYALGNLYKAGQGVPRDLAQAAALFKSAADARHPAAQLDYAIMLFNGEGIPKDEAGAARYFRMAAFEGNPVAANRLARLYAAGRGLPKNGVEAAHWHLLARAAGVSDPWLDGILASLTPADKAKVEDQLHKSLSN
ncbi:MAG: tetratricopeptide repeat protein [Janthinobacterium lividum]